ncbi:dynein heavy chain [Thecamonas trahens ATCC 50062]|uniref:Dynein heavy chain n=1 Tax=Thecamonas trahens ATCC 50062 TaxID=461836 RepID=A0A0L0DUW6_THETB|nr:dynein heavy chain [Thecamonas trahens ATCC 50062]KNC55308.1 dynein heavy chain [Thecamonas trahens ATCC 50062]|eukprot:XP_013753128.1 dynein heavy chain [Thecamonas trahens ATCC 50062]
MERIWEPCLGVDDPQAALEHRLIELLVVALDAESDNVWASLTQALEAFPRHELVSAPSLQLVHYLRRAHKALAHAPWNSPAGGVLDELRQLFPRELRVLDRPSLAPLRSRPTTAATRSSSASTRAARAAHKLRVTTASSSAMVARAGRGGASVGPTPPSKPNPTLFRFDISQVYPYDVSQMAPATAVTSSVSPHFVRVNAPPPTEVQAQLELESTVTRLHSPTKPTQGSTEASLLPPLGASGTSSVAPRMRPLSASRDTRRTRIAQSWAQLLDAAAASPYAPPDFRPPTASLETADAPLGIQISASLTPEADGDDEGESEATPLDTLLRSMRPATKPAAALVPDSVAALRSVAITPVSARKIDTALAVYPDSPASLSSKARIMAGPLDTVGRNANTLPVLEELFNVKTTALPQDAGWAESKPESGSGPCSPRASSPAGSASSASSSSAAYSPAASVGGASSRASHLSAADAVKLCKTAEHVVEFFSHSWPGDPVKFVHLVSPPASLEYRPYNLRVVDAARLDREHYTMSQMGVVHVVPGEATEFTPLAGWVRAASMFNVVRKIPFFANFIRHKLLASWKANVRFKLFCETRDVIRAKLFAANPSFQGTLREVQFLATEIWRAPLLEVEANTTHTASTFAEAQATARETAKDMITDIALKLEQHVLVLCEAVLRRTQWSDAPIEAQKTAAKKAFSLVASSASSKLKSMVEEKEEYLAKLGAIAQAADEAQSLGRFIRLVDYLAVEALVHNVQASLEALLSVMTRGSDEGVFSLDVVFANKAMRFEPGLPHLLNMVDSAYDSMTAVAASFLRIITMRSMRQYLEPSTLAHLEGVSAASGYSLADPAAAAVARFTTGGARRGQDALRDLHSIRHLLSPAANARINGLLEAIHATVEADYSAAYFDARVLTPLLDIHTYGQQWSMEAYAASKPSAAKLREDLAMVSSWVLAVSRMRKSSVVGMFRVDSTQLKLGLVPVPSCILAEMKEHLAAAAHEACEATLNNMLNTRSKLLRKPDQLRAFAEFVDFVRTTQASRAAFDGAAANVDALYELMRSHNVEIDIPNRILIEELDAVRDSFDEVVDDAERYAESRLAEMNVSLNKHIASLEHHVVSILSDLYTGDYVDPEAQPVAVIEELNDVEASLNAAKSKAETFSGWQSLFEVESPHAYDSLTDAMDVYTMRRTIWSELHAWNDNVASWRSAVFRTVDTNEVKAAVQTSYAKAFKMAHKLPDDPVVALWKSSVEEFKLHLPLILDLGNPALKPRHWRKIFAALAVPFSDALRFSLADLFEANVVSIRELVAELSAAASGEYHLELTLTSIQDAWKGAKFSVLPYKKKGKLVRRVYILGSVRDLVAQLEEHQLVLTTILGSRFVYGIKGAVDEWVGKLNALAALLDEWLALQRNWMYLEVIFVQKDIQAQLPAETKTFQSVHELWVKFMQGVEANPSVMSVLADGANAQQMFAHANAYCEKVRKSLQEYLETKRSAFPRFYFLSNDELLSILAHIREPRAVLPHLKKCFSNLVSLRFVGGSGAERLGAERLSVFAMSSAEGEEVEFVEPVSAAGNVEVWLVKVEDMMHETLASLTESAMRAFAARGSIADLLSEYPAQVLLATEAINWTAGVESAIRRESHPTNPQTGALHYFQDSFNLQLESLVALARSSELSALDRAALAALIVADVHARDVVGALAASHTASIDDFGWQKQLRYYWEDDGMIVIRQTSAVFDYQYEYLGNTARLVITPLTERCYLTLTSALALSMGGAPLGPAGTGKTETTKDLAKALGQLCVVFNCSDGLDVVIMGRFFSGLAQTGAWACFDEFNRIDIEVLSVIAQQVLTIQQALMGRAAEFEFEGSLIPLVPSYGCFVTMNPGYAGRTELPDNLMALLRPVAMMIPDYALIAEIILYSEGFSGATRLASKIVTMYKLASEQLSQQDHYDFGLRALKSVLVMAGALKRRAGAGESEEVVLISALRDANLPKFLSQDIPLFLAIISDLFPDADAPERAESQLQSAVVAALEADDLEAEPAFVSKVMQLHETLLVRHGVMLVGGTGTGKTTCYEALAHARSRVAVAGRSSASIYGSPHGIGGRSRGIGDGGGVGDEAGVFGVRLNPKACELYGNFDATTNVWSDGVVASVVREVLALELRGTMSNSAIEVSRTVPYFPIEGRPEVGGCTFGGPFASSVPIPSDSGVSAARAEKWLVFDGPVDSLWIEDMNTVLDDNKMLCLASGERIKLPETLRMLFEVPDLAVASPATVSRCGMVFMESVHLSWHVQLAPWERATVRSGLLSAAEARRVASVLRDSILPAALAFVRRDDVVSGGHPAPETGMVASCLTLLTQLLREGVPTKVFGAGEDDEPAGEGEVDNEATSESGSLGGVSRADRDAVSMYVLFAVVWSVGGWLDAGSRAKFSAFVASSAEFAALVPSLASYLSHAESDSVFDVYVQELAPLGLGSGARLGTWNKVLDASRFVYDPRVAFYDTFVPTRAAVQYGAVMQLYLRGQRSVMVTGKSGVGKSATVGRLLASGGLGGKSVASVAFSGATRVATLQDGLEAKLVRHSATALGPPKGGEQLVFIDNLNMPKREVWGAAPPLELLRQLVGFGGMFDRQRLQWVKLVATEFVGAMAPPGGGASEVSPRLLRLFAQLHMAEPGREDMLEMFEPILRGFLRSFSEEVVALAEPLMVATIDLFVAIREELLPSPSKSHYTFNLRHVSQVVQGMLQLRSLGEMPAPESVLQLWAHEACRVFEDRLVSSGDRTWFETTLGSVASAKLGVSWPRRVLSNVLYATHLRAKNPGFYAPLELEDSGLDNAAAAASQFVAEYNVEHASESPLELVFFRDAVKHLARILRILRQPRGSALLLGPDGCGRRSLARVAAHVAGYEVASVELSKGYGPAEFREDVKGVLGRAAAGKHVVFLLSDAQMVDEAFYDDVSNLLNSGEVPQLYSDDEEAMLVSSLRDAAKEAGVDGSRHEVLAYAADMAREHLHIVLVMSPVGSGFRARIRQFPALVDCCTIDWFETWPREALLAVARARLSSSEAVVRVVGDAAALESVAQVAVSMYLSVAESTASFRASVRRAAYITPASFLRMLEQYEVLVGKRHAALSTRREHFESGVEQLEVFDGLVREMEEELKGMQPDLEKAAAEAAAILEQVAADQGKADEVKAHEMQVLRDSAASDLEEVMPIYDDALLALGALNRDDLSEVKQYIRPPELVTTVMDAVCLLQGIKPGWAEAKKMMNKDFISTLERFDKDHIPEEVLRKLGKMLRNPDFNPETVGHTSIAAKSLCQWVIAIENYARVFKKVEPKRIALAEAEAQFEETMVALTEKRAELESVQASVDALQAKYEAACGRQEFVASRIAETQARLERAAKLVKGLGGEAARWRATLAELTASSSVVAYDMLMAAGWVTYLGVFTPEYRSQLFAGWMAAAGEAGLPLSPAASLSLGNLLAEPVEVRSWVLDGLPGDEFSVQNAVLAREAVAWPLFIDPQGQAAAWVRAMEAGAGLVVTKVDDGKLLRLLQSAIPVGAPVLIEGVGDELPPVLLPLLSKSLIKVNNQVCVRVGDAEVFYHSDFKLYLATRSANPSYLPQVFNTVNVVNFCVTRSNLTDQLLGDVIRLERNELERVNDELTVSLAHDKNALAESEETILRMVAAASSTILDDDTLIDALDESRATAEVIKKRVREAEATRANIAAARNEYLPVARVGMLLYFVLVDLGSLDSMYQFSLAFFSGLFARTLASVPALADEASDAELGQHLSVLQDALLRSVYSAVARGLFKKDTPLFSLMIAVALLRETGAVWDELWAVFVAPGVVGSSSALDDGDGSGQARPLWVSASGWAEVCALDSVLAQRGHTGLAESMAVEARAQWEVWGSSDEPEAEALPWKSELEPSKAGAFVKLLVVKAAREDRFVACAEVVVSSVLGAAFVERVPASLAEVHRDSSATTPIILVLSSGSDPTQLVLEHAAAAGFGSKLRMLSLGQGQGERAEAHIVEAAKHGLWVYLQNCHLALSWLPKLDRLVAQLGSSMGVHPEFRLWLTSKPCEAFPAQLLRRGLKLTNEPPAGLRANLLRTFTNLTERQFVLDEAASPSESAVELVWRRLVYGLAFFHGVVQERRRFGALGWNVPYGWTDADLNVSLAMLREALTAEVGASGSGSEGGVRRAVSVPFDALLFMVGEIHYGGRITDEWDNRTLRSVLSVFVHPGLAESASESGVRFLSQGANDYGVPSASELKSLENLRKAVLARVPAHDEPGVFGLHPNAQLAAQQAESRALIQGLIATQAASGRGGRVGSGLHGSAGETVAVLIEELLGRVPAKLDEAEAGNGSLGSSRGEAVGSLGVVLAQEMARFNKLLEVVTTSLGSLARGIRGEVVMTSEMEAMFEDLLYARVPNVWAAVAYPSLKALVPWMDNLVERVQFMREWLVGGVPNSFWLSAFFFPQGFLTGVLQEHARAVHVPIDDLVFVTHVLEAGGRRSADSGGVVVHGLYLEGAGWAEGALCEATPGMLVQAMPPLWLEPKLRSEAGSAMLHAVVPMYKTRERAGVLSTTGRSTNFVLALKLPTRREGDDEVFVRRGAALMLEP